MAQQIKIMIVDDHEVVLDSWKFLLESNPRFKVVSKCRDGNLALGEVEKLNPDIVLMDINMRPGNGFTSTRKILESNPEIKVIGISVHNQPNYAMRMLDAGGSGYLTKTSPFEEIHRGIEEIFDGRIYISEEVRRHMPPEYQ